MLLLTSLHLDDRDFWLAFGLAVVLPLQGCRFATKDLSWVSNTRAGGVSSREVFQVALEFGAVRVVFFFAWLYL